MKIININDFDTLNLSVDNTMITVDNDIITADNTTGEISTMYLDIIPSEYITDSYCKVDFYNELTQVMTNIDTSYSITNGLMRILFEDIGFNEGDSYELTVRKIDNKIIFRSKAYVTTSNDLQNYQLNQKINNVIQL